MKSKPIEIDERMSRKITGLGFICACMVVSIHVGMDVANMSGAARCFQEIIRRFFVMAPLPFFVFSGFFIAGHMGESSWWLKEVKKRGQSLAIPYLFWNVFSMVFFMSVGSMVLLLGIKFDGQTWLNFKGADTILTVLGLFPLREPYCPYLWYVRDLIVFVIAAPVFSYMFRERRKGLLSILVLMAICLMTTFKWSADLPYEARYMMDSWANGALFFGVGVFLRWNGEWLSAITKRLHGACIGWGWVLMICGGAVIVANVFYNVPNPLIISTALFMGGLWLAVPDMHLPKFLAGAAFPIYVMHGFVLFLVAIVTRATGLRQFAHTSNVAYVVQVVLSIAICVIVVSWMRKLFPRFSAMVFGGR